MALMLRKVYILTRTEIILVGIIIVSVIVRVCVADFYTALVCPICGDVMSKEGSWYDRVCVGRALCHWIDLLLISGQTLCLFGLCTCPAPTHNIIICSCSLPPFLSLCLPLSLFLSLSLSLSPSLSLSS